MVFHMNITDNQNGFALVVAMLCMAILTFIGMYALNTTNLELQIAGNDKVARQSFYKAEGGIQTGIELTEQNLGCPTGFSMDRIGVIRLQGRKFAYHEKMSDIPGAPDDVDLTKIPSETVRSVWIPDNPSSNVNTAPHTNLAVWGETRHNVGSGAQMLSGYEGKGKGVAGGGAVIDYEIHSQHLGQSNSQVTVAIKWRHMVGQEGKCNY
jgi:hypothetical protein